jgi:hypothetical protein
MGVMFGNGAGRLRLRDQIPVYDFANFDQTQFESAKNPQLDNAKPSAVRSEKCMACQRSNGARQQK